MSQPAHYRLDDLRRLAASLGVSVGLSPLRATAFASQLLWFDTAGAASHGISTLPDWLERMETGEVDPSAEGVIAAERAGTLVLDGRRGLPSLILTRAAGLAVEKARDVGIGLVRVEGLGSAGPPASVAAEVARLGPEAAAVLGPGSSWALALPSSTGLPLVIDPSLRDARQPLPPSVAPWSILIPDEGWLVVAMAIRALESLNAVHGRVAMALAKAAPDLGPLDPESWEARRQDILDRGLAPDPRAFAVLVRRASVLGLTIPQPLAGS